MMSIEEMATFCKRKGFVYQNSEVYGGMAGFFDFGPLGTELKQNIRQEWWNTHVRQRRDVAGMEGSIITHPKVWVASGHVENFADVMAECGKCRAKARADHLVEDKLKTSAAGMDAQQLQELVEKHRLKCQKCGSDAVRVTKPFSLMFQTNVGPAEGSTAYLRPETAQLMFADFRLIQENARMKLPFGIAQMGRAFRNEISPRDFLFRCREFEQMELEYFVHPKGYSDCPYVKDVYGYGMLVLSAEMQEKKQEPQKMTVKQLLEKEVISTPWHAYWLAFEMQWFEKLGVKTENFRIRQHVAKEKSHYALDTWDLEYRFPFGWKELLGMANRTDFDLQQHMKASGADLAVFDEGTKEKIVPHVIAEPSLGVERAFLVFMFDAYEQDKKRENVVLHLHPKLSPYKVAVFPLLKNKPELVGAAKKLYDDLKEDAHAFYDESGSIGRRYARMDEIGTPWCVTVDFDSLERHDVTIRDRDSTKQVRVQIKEVAALLHELLSGRKKFSDLS